MSLFESLQLQPKDPILSLPQEFAKDPRLKKVNLSVGAYRDESGKPKVLESVRLAEKEMYDADQNKEYLPIIGMKDFLYESQKLVFGEELVKKGLIAGAQTVGGSGALSLGGELINSRVSNGTAYIPDPTWPNHQALLSLSHLEIKRYPYFNKQTHTLEFEKMCETIQKLPSKSVILLHGSCHNPTGKDLSREQWKEISSLLKEKKLIPFFDLAYQGFGEGLDEDAWSIRYFMEQGHEMLVAVSHSKNFGLYGERIGQLSVVTQSTDQASIVESNLAKLIRSDYSTPPMHGAGIVKTILSSPQLKKMWQGEITHMRSRVIEMRKVLSSKLSHFDYLSDQKGFFSYLCIEEERVLQLRNNFGIYMPADSRINVAGLTLDTVDYVADAILSVT